MVNVIKGKTTEEIIADRNADEQAKSDKEAADFNKLMIIKERLEARVGTDIIIINIPEISGNIPLKFEKLTQRQLQNLLDARHAISLAGSDKNKAETEADKIFAILEMKSKDGLDAAYWKSGEGFSADVLTMILSTLETKSVSLTQEYVDELRKFRPI